MVVRRTKKVNKYRSHTTHGGGHRKKRRGAGSRGGRGRAGSGKRAGHKKIGIVLGRNGFNPRGNTKDEIIINVNYFTSKKLAGLVSAGKIVQEGDSYKVDLKKLGFAKLLGSGELVAKLVVTGECSPKAVDKITAAGGLVEESSLEEATKEE